ncbi:hypothetical protein U1Q18_041066 [Sarracenia purpurea var. burkii]
MEKIDRRRCEFVACSRHLFSSIHTLLCSFLLLRRLREVVLMKVGAREGDRKPLLLFPCLELSRPVRTSSLKHLSAA